MTISQKSAECLVSNRCTETGYILMSPFTYTRNNKTILNLRCNIHNIEWSSTYVNFVTNKSGCIRCGYDRMTAISRMPHDTVGKNILDRCLESHCAVISNFAYKNMYSRIILKCNIDKYEWNTTYHSFIDNKTGCPKCAKMAPITQAEADMAVHERCNKMRFELIEKFEYKTKKTTKINLKCLKCGGVWSTTYDGFIGAHKGCPRCRRSILELEIVDMLNKHSIMFKEQFKSKWLGFKAVDFFIPSKNIAIECQGEQHFYPVDHFGGMSKYKKVLRRDVEKFVGCQNNNIKMLYFAKKSTELPDTYFSKIYTEKEDILNWII